MTTVADVEHATATSVVADDHEQIQAALDDVTAALGGPVRELMLAYDTVLGLLSRHLFGMEVAVCPVVAQRLPGGRRTVRSHLTGAREMEWTMRQMAQVLWGDALAPRIPLEVLQRRLLALMAEHRAEEEQMLQAVEAVLTGSEGDVLAARLRHATVHAPTRPHPHAVRRLGWTRTLYRPVAEFDHVLDAMNSRRIPPPRYQRRRSRRIGPWAAYLLGQPLPAATEDRPADADT